MERFQALFVRIQYAEILSFITRSRNNGAGIFAAKCCACWLSHHDRGRYFRLSTLSPYRYFQSLAFWVFHTSLLFISGFTLTALNLPDRD